MTPMTALLFLAACSPWSADGVDIDGDAAGLVRDMLRPWEGATQRAPRVRNVNITGANLLGATSPAMTPTRKPSGLTPTCRPAG
jgi:hypothetical protein